MTNKNKQDSTTASFNKKVETVSISPFDTSSPKRILKPDKREGFGSFAISPTLAAKDIEQIQSQQHKITCQDIGKYFLSLSDEDAGDLISNLKLQKLVYYAQGFHLAIFDQPLFQERIEAWLHGPVIPDLYHAYKNHGKEGIPVPKYIDFSIYSEDVKNLLNEVYSVYGQFSAWKLRNMTHSENPWKDAINSNRVISNSSLKKYFLSQIEDDEVQ